jgi:ornithine carbamoyltransferase
MPMPDSGKRDFITLKDYTKAEIQQLLDLSKDIKFNPKKFAKILEGKDMALLFQKTSTRTRVSFEVAMHQLGGQSVYLDWRTTNFTLGDLTDEIRCLSRYVSAIMARVYSHKDVETMAAASSVPIINGLSDMYHPCQALADFFTIQERFDDLSKIKVVFIGDGSNNVANSLLIICAIMGVKISIVTPLEYRPDEDLIRWLGEKGLNKTVDITSDIEAGVKDANVLYTDTFVSMGQESETNKRLKIFAPYQLNKDIITKTGKTPFVMHCLPAHRGVEITSDVLDSPQSIVFDQSENRLHTQKALLVYLLANKKGTD